MSIGVSKGAELPLSAIANEDKVTDREWTALVLYDDAMTECSRLYANAGDPDASYIQAWHLDRKTSIVALGRREITWGEYNRQRAESTARAEAAEERAAGQAALRRAAERPIVVPPPIVIVQPPWPTVYP